MADLSTNRDLYCFIAELVKRRSESGVPLESYLENLRRHALASCDRAALPVAEFAGLLEAAFEPAVSANTSCADPTSGYQEWERRIDEQIRDLREMKDAGTLDNEYRYFGVDAPSGARWYNFDPCTYLECAVAGTFGGWQDGDDTGRAYVPGEVAVIDASGALTSIDPRALDQPAVELPKVTWQVFIEFLDAGQWYE